jgi:hypothetical protein
MADESKFCFHRYLHRCTRQLFVVIFWSTIFAALFATALPSGFISRSNLQKYFKNEILVRWPSPISDKLPQKLYRDDLYHSYQGGIKREGALLIFGGPEIFSLIPHLIFQKSKDVSAQRP